MKLTFDRRQVSRLVRGIAVSGTVWAFAMSVSATSKRECTIAEATQADADLDRLTDWRNLYRTFKNFGHCDDGGLAEGRSDVVARLLTERWQTTSELARLIKADPRFEKFVL